MPLKALNESNRCTARCKSRNLKRCNNMRVVKWGTGTTVCRFHGACDPAKIKRGAQLPQYIDGRSTKAYREQLAKEKAELHYLAKILSLEQETPIQTGNVGQNRFYHHQLDPAVPEHLERILEIIS